MLTSSQNKRSWFGLVDISHYRKLTEAPAMKARPQELENRRQLVLPMCLPRLHMTHSQQQARGGAGQSLPGAVDSTDCRSCWRRLEKIQYLLLTVANYISHYADAHTLELRGSSNTVSWGSGTLCAETAARSSCPKEGI